MHLIHVSYDFQLHKKEVIIDCIFGYGLSRKVEGEFTKIINRINSAQAQVISIDMPSGLFTNNNSENDGTIIKAQLTFTFQCMKLALLQASYYDYYGKVVVIDIGLSHQYLSKTDKCQDYIIAKDLPQIKKRDKFAHKGNFGHALLVGGEAKMRGALILAAKSAFRSGIGTALRSGRFGTGCSGSVSRMAAATVPRGATACTKEPGVISYVAS